MCFFKVAFYSSASFWVHISFAGNTVALIFLVAFNLAVKEGSIISLIKKKHGDLMQRFRWNTLTYFTRFDVYGSQDGP